jgi:hypothetical protein
MRELHGDLEDVCRPYISSDSYFYLFQCSSHTVQMRLGLSILAILLYCDRLRGLYYKARIRHEV